MKRRTKIKITVSLAIALAGVLYCGWIEALNRKRGNYLPRQDMDGPGNSSWRHSPVTSERMWRQANIEELGIDYADRELSEEQREKMQRDIREALEINHFHTVVHNATVLYLVLPLVALASVLRLAKHRELGPWVWPVSGTLALTCIALYLMLSRGYFTAVLMD